ncbi:MAG: metalloregulator ArsR/SmtB family transcription factor [Nitrospira sp. CR1.3]|nr:metalloregulator ArsR/SmtB family transcription factor [Nitrospira sp. CR1.3]
MVCGMVKTQREKAVLLFHALSDLTRLELLDKLKNGEQCVCDLTEALHSGQSRLSFHLKVLKEAELINDRREGRWVYYALNPDAIEDLEDFVRDLKETTRLGGASKSCA